MGIRRRINSAGVRGSERQSAMCQRGIGTRGRPRKGSVSANWRPSSAPVTKSHGGVFQSGEEPKDGSISEHCRYDTRTAQLKIEGKAIRAQRKAFSQRINQKNKALSGTLRSSPSFSTSKLEYNYNNKTKVDKSRDWFLENKDTDLIYIDSTDVRTFPLGDNFGYGHNLLLNNFFLHSFISDEDQDLTNENEESECPASYASSSDEGMKPTIRLVSRTSLVQADGMVDAKSQNSSDGHAPTIDEEGSDSTVVSLGSKIQRMSQLNVMTTSDIKNSEEENRASENEWRQLLSFNHSLLLGNTSTGEKVRKYPYILEERGEEAQFSLHNNSKHKNSESNLGGETGYLYSNTLAKREKDQVNQNETAGKKFQVKQREEATGMKASTEYFNGDLKTQLTIEEEDPISDVNSDSHSSYIEEENRGKSSNKKSYQILITDGEENKAIPSKDDSNTSLTNNNQNILNRLEHQTTAWLTNEYKQDEISVDHSSSIPTVTQNNQMEYNSFSQSVIDIQKKTGWLPANTVDIASKYTENQGNLKKFELSSNSLSSLSPRLHQKRQPKAPSNSIVEALDMIRRDQRKDSNGINIEKNLDPKSHNNLSEETYCSETVTSKAILNKEKRNHHLELNSLIEKIKIFIQELSQKWTEELIKGDEKYLHVVEEAEKNLETICIKVGLKDPKNETKKQSQIHQECEEQKLKIRTEMDAKIKKNLDLIRKLLDDKSVLTEKCEQLSQTLTQKEHHHLQQIKLIEEKKSLEMKDLKERITASDQSRREKWTQQKAKLIKDSAYRSLEAKMKEMTRQQQDETARLKETHRHELWEKEEDWTARLREESEHLRVKYEQEKEEACRREREREADRFQQDLDRSDSTWQNRLEVSFKQFNQAKMTWEEDSQRQLQRWKFDREDEIRSLKKGMELTKEEYEEKLKELNKSHEREIFQLSEGKDKAQAEVREQLGKEYEEVKQKFEREIKERFRRQRDKEIEKAITEIQQEMTSQIEEKQKNFNCKIKSLKERYESELRELEECERISHARYLEMKGVLAQKEEEVVYLRARLHAHTLEMGDFKRMFCSGS